MKAIFSFWLICTLLFSCNENEAIVKLQDFDLPKTSSEFNKKLIGLNQELKFWNDRLTRDTGNFIDMMKLASRHLALFSVDGSVCHITKADSLINSSSQKLNQKDADILFSLAQVTAMKHEFNDALKYTHYAERAGGARYAVKLLNFDMSMERGDYDNAYSQLSQLSDRTSFDYLIRSAKFNDHTGNLEEAILLMEKAREKTSGNHQLYLWSLSNLGDMYGHAGKIKKSYDCYVEVLRIDPSYLYALKGIAWIAYSHDRNPVLATKLLDHIATLTKSPDILLSISEVAASQNNRYSQQQLNERFIETVSGSEYGDMYNKYLIDIYLDQNRNPKRALELSKREVESRPTPETYSWLARSLLANSDTLGAYNIIMDRVFSRTFEPEVNYHMAKIFLANGKTNEAREILTECLESDYELGPVKANAIRILMKNIHCSSVSR